MSIETAVSISTIPEENDDISSVVSHSDPVLTLESDLQPIQYRSFDVIYTPPTRFTPHEYLSTQEIMLLNPEEEIVQEKYSVEQFTHDIDGLFTRNAESTKRVQQLMAASATLDYFKNPPPKNIFDFIHISDDGKLAINQELITAAPANDSLNRNNKQGTENTGRILSSVFPHIRSHYSPRDQDTIVSKINDYWNTTTDVFYTQMLHTEETVYERDENGTITKSTTRSWLD